MTMWTVVVFSVISILVLVKSDLTLENVLSERNTLIQKEMNMMIGSDISLGDTEEQANEIIMKLKRTELDYGFANPQFFNFSKHFFEYKDEVKKSTLYKIIKQMPKGAVLHAHDTGILSPDYVLALTYWQNLYVCFEENHLHLLFSSDVPNVDCATQWQLMKNARYSSGNIEKFDAELRKYVTLLTDKPNETYSDINLVWSKFALYFIVSNSLFTYKPVWEQYFYDTLKALREDNVMYLEIRSVLPKLYDIDGNVFDELETVRSYKKVLESFMEDYPDFFGAKLIYAPLRSVDSNRVNGYIKIAKKIKEEFPDFLAGFDLVGQEDLGTPTKDFLKELVKESKTLDYFFHAGETNWYGTSSDENLFDAIVLNARRIGHAFALIKHPVLIEEIKKRDIAIEVNVISNAVLKLVEDVRNHPLASFIAQGLPVVISSDDPGLWEADPLSHDFYVTFVGVASRHADIKLLKQLALNSIYYSTYRNKDKMVYEFDMRWAKFVQNVIRDHCK
ncbi:adenosine deaminase 2-like [Zerene cesonia]|uniref:adenosine deaminase 2-like n=1 Tax=Zerene cesonia TaxID=33412 RepID=UPI0018E575E4|nr:adenosine deaminase 2-like [Zerene cesonia]